MKISFKMKTTSSKLLDGRLLDIWVEVAHVPPSLPVLVFAFTSELEAGASDLPSICILWETMAMLSPFARQP